MHFWTGHVFAVSSLCAMLVSCNNTFVGPSFSSTDDLSEAIIRFQLYDNDSGFFNHGVVDTSIKFFVFAAATMDTVHVHLPKQFADLPGDFLQRFTSIQRPLRLLSQMRFSSGGGVYDTASGGRAILFWVGPVQWKGASNAEVEGGFNVGGLDAEGELFYASRHGVQWAVDSVKLYWVS
jgi:hypothetical protein